MLTEAANDLAARRSSTSGAVPIVAVIVVLAGLDLVGALLARHWADHRQWVSFGAGMAVFAALFVVYALSLEHASLTTVTMGWIVVLQIGVIAIDRVRGGAIPMDRMTAIVAMVALQAYLILGDTAAA